MTNYSFKYRLLGWKNDIREFWIKYRLQQIHEFQRKKSAKTLKRIDSNQLQDNLYEIRLFTNLRNESLRLPHFLQYYKMMGVSRFFFIDNNSTDYSSEIILQDNKSHLFITTDNFSNHHFWIEHLLETYGKNCWCMVVDIDELFSYPNQDFLKLFCLTGVLDGVKHNTHFNWGRCR
jgi:Glycosyl transferase family 2